MRLQQGSKRNGWNIAADAVYTMNSNTAFNLRGAYYQVEDKRDYPDMSLTPDDYREPLAQRLVRAVHGRAADSLLPVNQHGELRHLRRRQRLVADSRGLQPARPLQQVPAAPLDQGRQRSALEARRGGPLPLLQLRRQCECDRGHDLEPEPPARRPSLGELPARRARQQLERAVRARCSGRTPRCTRCTCRTTSAFTTR